MAPKRMPPASPADKKRMNRIRLNQQRCRARKQEYVTSLEDQVKAHSVDRQELEALRTAYCDQEAEILGLRRLLAWAGIDPGAVGHQNMSMHGGQYCQIRPKFGRPFLAEHPVMTNQISNGASHRPVISSPATSMTAMPMGIPSMNAGHHGVPFIARPVTDTSSLSSASSVSFDSLSQRRPSMDMLSPSGTFSPPLYSMVEGGIIQGATTESQIVDYSPTSRERDQVYPYLTTHGRLPTSSDTCQMASWTQQSLRPFN